MAGEDVLASVLVALTQQVKALVEELRAMRELEEKKDARS